jgi:hypothetical protein
MDSILDVSNFWRDSRIGSLLFKPSARASSRAARVNPHKGQRQYSFPTSRTINRFMRSFLLSTVLVLTANLGAALELPLSKTARAVVKKIRLEDNSESVDHFSKDQVRWIDGDSVLAIGVGLGSTPPYLLKVVPLNEDQIPFVEYSYQTSVSISDSGPHLDLKNWKSFRSPWKRLEGAEGYAWKVPFVEDTRFPNVSKEEFLQAVRKAELERQIKPENRWLDVARRCATVHEEPCHVGVSRIFLRIMVKAEGGTKEVQRIMFEIPMGC